jgi:hypothetical protein
MSVMVSGATDGLSASAHIYTRVVETALVRLEHSPHVEMGGRTSNETRRLLNKGVLGAGRLKRSVARVKSDLAVDTEIAPPSSRVAVGRRCTQAPWGVFLGDGPGIAGAVEAQDYQAAQIQCCGAVVQPVVVLGDAAVADFTVAASEPGDRTFDHRPVLTIFVEPVRVSG